MYDAGRIAQYAMAGTTTQQLDETARRLAENSFLAQADRLRTEFLQKCAEVDADCTRRGLYNSSLRLTGQRVAIKDYIARLASSKLTALLDAHRLAGIPIGPADRTRIGREIREVCMTHATEQARRLTGEAEKSNLGRSDGGGPAVAVNRDAGAVLAETLRELDIQVDKSALAARASRRSSPPGESTTANPRAPHGELVGPRRTEDIVQSLRGRLSDLQRQLLDRIWKEYLSTGQPLAKTTLHVECGGRSKVRPGLEHLGGSIVLSTTGIQPETYHLTLLGALLTSEGDRVERTLAKFLEFVRSRIRECHTVRAVSSKEITAHELFTGDEPLLLVRAFRLHSRLLSLGGNYAEQSWNVTLTDNLIDCVLEAEDLGALVRSAAAEGFEPERPLDDSRRSAVPPLPVRTPSPAEDFTFVHDPALRTQLLRDWREAQDVRTVSAWKACVVLCGSVMEGILFDALYSRGAPGSAGQTPPKRIRLQRLVEEASKRGILKGAMTHLGDALREFRNLIHPEKQLDLGVVVSEHEAEIAVRSVQILIRELSGAPNEGDGQGPGDTSLPA